MVASYCRTNKGISRYGIETCVYFLFSQDLVLTVDFDHFLWNMLTLESEGFEYIQYIYMY